MKTALTVKVYKGSAGDKGMAELVSAICGDFVVRQCFEV